ncbi:MAG TPA: DUF362 domain-containing protein [bacterium]|nr:DUF362 domain-containing protein [bacterium]
MQKKIAIVKCRDYKKSTVRDAINRIFDLLGWESSEQGILLKPNMLSARSPDEAVTTHPVILEVLSEILPEKIYIGDSPPGSHKGIEQYWQKCGYSDVASKTKATLVKLEGKSTLFNLNISGRIVSFPVSDLVFTYPVFNLPKFKTHNITVLSLCMKNLYGLISGYSKGLLHTKFPEPEFFNRFIVELYNLLKNRIIFNLIDAVEIMDKNGPSSGRKRHYGYLIAGKDAVCVDIFCAGLAGLLLEDVVFLKIYSAEYGVPDFEVVGDKPEVIHNFCPPLSSAIFKIQDKPVLSNVLRFSANRLNIIPVIEHKHCRKCMECFKVCPVKAISEDLKINRKKCINCLCCFEVCPHRAIKIKRSLLARFILP